MQQGYCESHALVVYYIKYANNSQGFHVGYRSKDLEFTLG